MRIALLIITGLLFTQTLQAQDEVIRLSEPVIETEEYEVFGEEVNEWSSAISLSDAVKGLKEYEGKEIIIEASVSEVCKKKGCFFIAQSGNSYARITFKDYGFFIPTNSAGKTAKFIGVLHEKEISEEQAEHYQEDLGNGKTDLKGPQKEYTLVARSILIHKSK